MLFEMFFANDNHASRITTHLSRITRTGFPTNLLIFDQEIASPV